MADWDNLAVDIIFIQNKKLMRLKRAKSSQINKLLEFNHYFCENHFNIYSLFIKIFLSHQAIQAETAKINLSAFPLQVNILELLLHFYFIVIDSQSVVAIPSLKLKLCDLIISKIDI